MVTAAEALRYAMSLPVAAVVSGIDGAGGAPPEPRRRAGFTPMTAEEMDALRARVARVAADGRYELYKTTTHFDAKVGREQHGYPPREDLPL